MSIHYVIIASPGGNEEQCEIEFARDASTTLTVKSQRFGVMSFVDDNWFGALLKFRQRIELDGYLLLCNAARKDAYPSQMMLQMGGGRKIYILSYGRQVSAEDLVDILSRATIDQVGTVEEQRLGYENWLRSFK